MATQPAQAEHVRRSNSSNSVGLWSKLKYNFGLLRMRMRTNNGGAGNALERIREMEQLVAEFEQQTGLKAADSTIVEVGFGARPERAFAMTAFFGKVVAMDLDAPLLSLADVPGIVRKNGLERGFKSAMRHILFDARGWRAYHKMMKAKQPRYDPARANFVIGNAGEEATWKGVGQADLIFSQDVFEHIPASDLRTLLEALRGRIKPGGYLQTTPMIFTGISGGHDLEWYAHTVNTNQPETAWGHLLDPDFVTNTYLNKMKRRDYSAMFTETGYRVLRDVETRGRLGAQHLTPEKRAALAAFDEYELFSNNVQFWLVPE